MLPERKVAAILIKSKKTLSLAESCSGGLLGHRLTNIPGSSDFFRLSVVAYSNLAKTKILHVPSALLKQHGAVSEPVARRMAQNVRTLGNTDFGISITGIAGPGGGTRQKPVGLVFIAVAGKGYTVVKNFHLKGSRQQIKQQATSQALRLLLTLF